MIAAQKNILIKLYEFNRYNNTQNMMLQESVDNKTLLLFVAVTVVVIFVFFSFYIAGTIWPSLASTFIRLYLHIVLCFITKKTILSVFISLSY